MLRWGWYKRALDAGVGAEAMDETALPSSWFARKGRLSFPLYLSELYLNVRQHVVKVKHGFLELSFDIFI